MARAGRNLLWGTAAVWAVYYVTFVILDFGSPLWLDEVFSATVTAFPLSEGWGDIRRDVHPPGYPVLLILMRTVTGAQDPHLLQLVNLLGLPIVAAALWRVGFVTGLQAALIAFVLFFGTWYAFGYLFELRVYFILLALSFLLCVQLLMEPTAKSEAWSIPVAIALTFAHFFGVALACTVLAWRIALLYRDGDSVRMKRLAITLAVILFITAIWIVQARTTYTKLVTEGYWLTNDWKSYSLAMLSAELPVLFLFVLGCTGILRRQRCAGLAGYVVVAVIVVAGTAALSLIEPIVTRRNLIVVMPVVILLAVTVWDSLGRPFWTIPLLIVLSIMAAPDVRKPIKPPHNFDFVAQTAYSDACTDAPIYMPHTWPAYQGIARAFNTADRPPALVEDVVVALQGAWPDGCDIVGFVIEDGFDVDSIVNEFAADGFAVSVEGDDPNLAPNAKRAVVLRLTE